MSSYSGIADDESSNAGKKVSKSEHAFLRDNTGNIDLSGLDDDLSLGSNTDIRSPDGIPNHDPFKDAQDLLTHDNARIKLVEEEENNCDEKILIFCYR